MYFTSLLALVGTLLGILNWHRTFRNDQTRIKADFVVCPVLNNAGKYVRCPGIRIVNISKFSVHVIDAGLAERGTNVPLSHGIKNPFPIEIKPMDFFEHMYPIDFPSNPSFQLAYGVRVETATGYNKVFKSKLLRTYSKWYKTKYLS